MDISDLVHLADRLDSAGLNWEPEIGDEVVDRAGPDKIAILIDPQGLSPEELRATFIWVPTIEQLLIEIEQRNYCLFHAGSSGKSGYEVVLKTSDGLVRGGGVDLRLALGDALEQVLGQHTMVELH